MVSKFKLKNLTWVDIESPTTAEVLDLKEEYNIPSIVAEELNTCTLRSKFDYYEKYKNCYIVIHFPSKKGSEVSQEEEFDFVISKDLLITTRYQKNNTFEKILRKIGDDSFFEKNQYFENAGQLFAYVIKELYKNTLDDIETVSDSLKKIEQDIFSDKQKESVGSISLANRQFINIKQSLRHHNEILSSFENIAVDIFGNNFSHEVTNIISEHNRVKNTLEIAREILNDLRTSNDSIMTTKANETIKTLTIISFTLLPITLITGIFGMNTSDSALIIRDDGDFILVLIFIIILWLIMFIYFKSKKWL